MTDQPDDKATRTRNGRGRFDRDPNTARRDAEAARLRGRGWTYQRIADELGVSKQTAYDAVQRALRDTLEEPAADVRQLELARLDDMYAAVMGVLEREHITVSQGRVVRRRLVDEQGMPIITGSDADGKPIYAEEDIVDDGPVLAAVDRLLKIQERRAKLLGLDAPTKAEVGGKLSYEIVGVNLEAL